MEVSEQGRDPGTAESYPYAALIDAGWFADEAEEICAYARDSGLSVQEVEALARLCQRGDMPVSYRALLIRHLSWPVTA